MNASDPLAIARTVFEITQNIPDVTMSVIHDVLHAANPHESQRDAVRDVVVAVAAELERQADWEEKDWIETCDGAARFIVGAIRSQSPEWQKDDWAGLVRMILSE